jgi:hypothetical protein
LRLLAQNIQHKSPVNFHFFVVLFALKLETILSFPFLSSAPTCLRTRLASRSSRDTRTPPLSIARKSPVNFHFFVVLFALKLETIDVLPGPHHFRAIESGGDPEPNENGEQGAVYKTTAASLIPIPQLSAHLSTNQT